MLITNFNYDRFYSLLTSVLEASFNISTTKISDVNDFNNYIDIEFRKIIWPDYNHSNTATMNDLLQMRKSTLCIVQSSMEFTTMLFSFPDEISNDILIFGPFLEVRPDDEFIINVLDKNDLPINLKQTFLTYYNSLPVVNIINVISTLNKLFESFISNYDSSSMYSVDFSKNKPKLNKYIYDYNNDTKFYIEYHKKYKSYLNNIFNCIRYGKDATEILSNYIELTGMFKNNCINKVKNNLCILNAQFESELLKEPIPPVEVGKLSTKNQNKIENENNRIKLIKLPYKILQDYKNLFLCYNLKQYSYTVRSAIEYINFNLQSDLSLSIISSYIGKNASFLSNQFKKETGVTITRYIQKKRVEESIRMLYSSDLSVQEIAHSVGIDDLSWFCKVFKNITGTSPTKYKATLYKNNLK